MQNLNVLDLKGETDYSSALMLQGSAMHSITNHDSDDYLFLLRHNPVITLGYFAKEKHILATKDFLKSKGIDVHKTDRGGQVTYHGPGQLIGYPILDIKRKKVRDYSFKLCQTLIDLLEDYGIKSERGRKELFGIWAKGRKIAAIGIAHKTFYLKDRFSEITTHGFALYVLNDMENFKYINPCGVPGMKLTSMEELLGKKPDFEELKEKYTKHFIGVFEYDNPKKA